MPKRNTLPTPGEVFVALREVLRRPVVLSREGSPEHDLWTQFDANPKNDMGRLVLADHLDENGKPGLAELLRMSKPNTENHPTVTRDLASPISDHNRLPGIQIGDDYTGSAAKHIPLDHPFIKRVYHHYPDSGILHWYLPNHSFKAILTPGLAQRIHADLAPEATSLSRDSVAVASLWPVAAKDHRLLPILADHLDEQGQPHLADLIRRAVPHASASLETLEKYGSYHSRPHRMRHSYREIVPVDRKEKPAPLDHPTLRRIAHSGKKLVWYAVNHKNHWVPFVSSYPTASHAASALNNLRGELSPPEPDPR